MRGSLVNRGKNRWALVLDRYVTDPATKKSKRKQTWVTFHGSKKEAGDKLTELVRSVNRNEFVEPSKRTVGAWLDEWVEKTVKPNLRPRTYAIYKSVIDSSLKPALGDLRLQQLRPTDIQEFHETHASLSSATRRLHHAVLSGALKAALKLDYVVRNVASVERGPKRAPQNPDDVLRNCWSLEEARAFLNAAKAAGPRPAAFYSLALDSGARRGELCGLKWTDLDLDAGKMSITRQLSSSKLGEDGQAIFGLPKSGRPRTIDLGPDTVKLLRDYKRYQAELKMKNRATYVDHGLVFVREFFDVAVASAPVGSPLQMGNIAPREFARIIKAANVKTITFHGLRHTCATLMLLSGEHAKVVSERLGHAKITMTLDIYSHVLPSMQQQAAQRLGSLLHG